MSTRKRKVKEGMMEGRFLWFYQRDWTRGRNRGMGSNEEENEEEKKGEEDDDDTARETDDKRSWVVIFTITGIKWWVLTFFSCNVSVVIVDTKVENKSRLRKKKEETKRMIWGLASRILSCKSSKWIMDGRASQWRTRRERLLTL